MKVTSGQSTHSSIHYDEIPLFHFGNIINNDFKDKPTKGVIFGNFGAMNYGDEAILAGQLVELQQVKQCQVTVVSRFPQQIKDIHHTDAIGLLDITNIIKTIAASDFIIVGGGGLFCKNDAGIKGFLFQLYTAKLFLFFPWLLHKKTYVLGIGIYANMNPVLAPIVLLLLRTAAKITVRDAHSHDYLNKNHIQNEFYKDNSFLLPLEPTKEISHNEYFKNKLDKKKYNIGFGLKKPDAAKEAEKLIDEITEFVSVNANDTIFWMYPLDANTGVSHDEDFAKEIRARSIKKNGMSIIYSIPTHWHPAKLFSSFSLMDYFIAMRLHASIFCYRTPVPFYGITYDEKCTSFLTSITHSFHQITDVSAKEMQKEFDTIKKKKV